MKEFIKRYWEHWRSEEVMVSNVVLIFIIILVAGLLLGHSAAASEVTHEGEQHEQHEQAPPAHNEEGHDHCVDHGVVLCDAAVDTSTAVIGVPEIEPAVVIHNQALESGIVDMICRLRSTNPTTPIPSEVPVSCMKWDADLAAPFIFHNDSGTITHDPSEL